MTTFYRHIRSKDNIVLIGLLLATFFWGCSFTFNKLAIPETGVIPYLFWRFLLSSLFFAVVFKDKWPKVTKIEFQSGAELGIYLFVILWLQTAGLTNTSASRSAFITALYLPMTLPLSILMLKKKFHWIQVAVVAIGFLGLTLLTQNSGTLNQFSLKMSWGDSITFLSACLSALQIVRVEQRVRTARLDPFNMAIWQIFICTMCFGLAALLIPNSFGSLGNWNPLTWSIKAWVSLFFNSIFTTCFAFSMQIIAQKTLGAVKAAVIYSLEGPFSAIFASLVIGEHFNSMEKLGALVIFMVSLVPEKWIHPDEK